MDPVPVPVAAGVLDAAQDRRQRLSSLDSRPSPISRQIISNEWVILHTGQVLYYDWCLGAAGEMLSCFQYGSGSIAGWEEDTLPFLQLPSFLSQNIPVLWYVHRSMLLLWMNIKNNFQTKQRCRYDTDVSIRKERVWLHTTRWFAYILEMTLSLFPFPIVRKRMWL